jgi:hypothetical protein
MAVPGRDPGISHGHPRFYFSGKECVDGRDSRFQRGPAMTARGMSHWKSHRRRQPFPQPDSRDSSPAMTEKGRTIKIDPTLL